MQIEEFKGHTLKQIAKKTGLVQTGYRVFTTESKDDPDGKLVGTGYTLNQILYSHPEISETVVYEVTRYDNEIIIRTARKAIGKIVRNAYKREYV